jgi:hypothetical protein
MGTPTTDTGTPGDDAGADGGTSDEDGGTDAASTDPDAGVDPVCEAIRDPIQCTHDDTVCPDGFTCQTHPGIVFQRVCVILCSDAPCPCGATCTAHSGPGLTPWMECNP